jgi:hypothetical protein
MKLPWFKFYPSDWRADPLLRRCSLSARGLWIELITVMHESADYGHLDPSLTERDIARLVGSPLKNVRSALAELERNRVFDRGEKRQIVSRRMVRDHAKAMKDKENGRKGGNPGLMPGVNPEVKAQIPEARIQRPEIPEFKIQNRDDYDRDHDPDVRTEKKISIGYPPSISETALRLTEKITALCGFSGNKMPPHWAGAPRYVQSWLNQGWTAEQIEASCRQQMANGAAPKNSIAYFERGIAQFVAEVTAPVPTVTLNPARTYERQLTPHQQRLAEHRAAIERYGIERTVNESNDRAAGDHHHPDNPEPL